MRVLAFSDLHLDPQAAEAILAASADADLVIGAGDFAQRRTGLAAYMDLLAPLADKAIYVPGNNESHAELLACTRATVLHGTAVTWQGTVVAGLGAAVPPLPPIPWDSYDLTEDAAATLLSGLPRADILVSHSPPRDACDRHAALGPIGSVAVRDAILRLRPRLVFCGHVHDDWGATALVGHSRVCNLGPTVNWFEV